MFARAVFWLLADLSNADYISWIIWQTRLRNLTYCVLLLGFLLSIYVWEQTRTMKFAIAAAALQLLALSKAVRSVPWTAVELVLKTNVLPIAVFAWLIWGVSKWTSNSEVHATVRFTAKVLCGCIAVAFAGGFIATAGTTVEERVSPLLFTFVVVFLSAAVGYGFFAWQLFAIIEPLAKESKTDS